MIAQTPIVQGWCASALRPTESGDGWALRMRPRASRLTHAQARDNVAGPRRGGCAPHSPLISELDAGGLLAQNTPRARGEADRYAIHPTAKAGGQSPRHVQARGEVARRRGWGSPHVPQLSELSAEGLLAQTTPRALGKAGRYAIHPTAKAGGQSPRQAQAWGHLARRRGWGSPHVPQLSELSAEGLLAQITPRALGKAGRYAILPATQAWGQSPRHVQARGEVARRRGLCAPHAPPMPDLDAGGLLAQTTPRARGKVGRYAIHPTAQAWGQSPRQVQAWGHVAGCSEGGVPHTALLSELSAGGLLSKNTPNAQGKVDRSAILPTAQAGGQRP